MSSSVSDSNVDSVSNKQDVPPNQDKTYDSSYTCWTLWHYENDRKRPFKHNFKEIGSFQTIEEFQKLYDSLTPASELKQGSDYAIFKTGIMPLWEDEANKKGGRWLLSIEKRWRKIDLDRFWLDIVYFLMDQDFQHSDEVCGSKVTIRQKGDQIGIWTSDAQNSEAVLEIGKKLKEILQIPMQKILGYQVHKDPTDKTRPASKKYAYTV